MADATAALPDPSLSAEPAAAAAPAASAPMTKEKMELLYKQMLAQGRESMNQQLTTAAKERKKARRTSGGLNHPTSISRGPHAAPSAAAAEGDKRPSSPDTHPGSGANSHAQGGTGVGSARRATRKHNSALPAPASASAAVTTADSLSDSAAAAVTATAGVGDAHAVTTATATASSKPSSSSSRNGSPATGARARKPHPQPQPSSAQPPGEGPTSRDSASHGNTNNSSGVSSGASGSGAASSVPFAIKPSPRPPLPVSSGPPPSYAQPTASSRAAACKVPTVHPNAAAAYGADGVNGTGSFSDSSVAAAAAAAGSGSGFSVSATGGELLQLYAHNNNSNNSNNANGSASDGHPQQQQQQQQQGHGHGHGHAGFRPYASPYEDPRTRGVHSQPYRPPTLLGGGAGGNGTPPPQSAQSQSQAPSGVSARGYSAGHGHGQGHGQGTVITYENPAQGGDDAAAATAAATATGQLPASARALLANRFNPTGNNNSNNNNNSGSGSATAAGYGRATPLSPSRPGTHAGTHGGTHVGPAAVATEALVVHSTHPRPLSLTHALPPSVTDPHPATLSARVSNTASASAPSRDGGDAGAVSLGVNGNAGKRGGYLIAPSAAGIAKAAAAAAAAANNNNNNNAGFVATGVPPHLSNPSAAASVAAGLSAGRVIVPTSARVAAAAAATAAAAGAGLGRSTAAHPVTLAGSGANNNGSGNSYVPGAGAGAGAGASGGFGPAPLMTSGVYRQASARLIKGDREQQQQLQLTLGHGRRFDASFTEGLASSARAAVAAAAPYNGGAHGALSARNATATGGFSSFAAASETGGVFLPAPALPATTATALSGPNAGLLASLRRPGTSAGTGTGVGSSRSHTMTAISAAAGAGGAGSQTVRLDGGSFVDVDAAAHSVLLQRLHASDAERRALSQRVDELETFKLRYQRSLEEHAALGRRLGHTQRSLSALLLQQQLRGIDGIEATQAAVRELDEAITRAEQAAKAHNNAFANTAAYANANATTSTVLAAVADNSNGASAKKVLAVSLTETTDPVAAATALSRTSAGPARLSALAAATGAPVGINCPLNTKTAVAASAARLARLELLHHSALTAAGGELAATAQTVSALEAECERLERVAVALRGDVDREREAAARAEAAADGARAECARAEKEAWEWREKAVATRGDLEGLWREHKMLAGENETLAPTANEAAGALQLVELLKAELAAEKRASGEARARAEAAESELGRVRQELSTAVAAHASCGEVAAQHAARETTVQRLDDENKHASQLVAQLQWQLAAAEEANGRVQDRAVRAEREIAAFQVRLEELMQWRSQELVGHARRFAVAERARAKVAELDPVIGVEFTKAKKNAVVRAVAENSPAAECGLVKGDRILNICERNVKRKADVLTLMMAAKADAALPLLVLRKVGKGKSRGKVKMPLELRVGAVGYDAEQLSALVRIAHFREDDFHSLRALGLSELEHGDAAATSATGAGARMGATAGATGSLGTPSVRKSGSVSFSAAATATGSALPIPPPADA